MTMTTPEEKDGSAAEVSGSTGLEIAIIGMSGRFPGADSVEELWRNLRDGVESMTVLTEEELRAMGEPPEVFRSPRYVRIVRSLSSPEMFDAAFFGVNPREADVMDPQHRLFMECAWSALEDAGYDPGRCKGEVGVFAGSRLSWYLMNVYSHPELVRAVGDLATQTANDKDYLATRISYKLDLGGPSVTVQTACSTALVATHLACQALLSGECDMALAGGVALRVPNNGYMAGDVNSPDGRVRAFDAKAQGTIFGSGMGAVVLKRLADALEDGDTVHAVIKGSAVTNDGSRKVGYTAPSVDGQYRVVRAALVVAGVEPETVSYIEAHGTGTPVGDPIEVSALIQVFREKTSARQFCALGSVKTNVGHLSTAAGAAGLIKTVLALKHKQIPPSLLYEEPNPQIDFANSPFFVNTRLRDWESDGQPRRAGVSAFGIGGTNAHIVLEEAPPTRPAALPSRPLQLLPLSARTETALATLTASLAAHLETHPELALADAAYTLQAGRKRHAHRRVVVCRDAEHVRQMLQGLDPEHVVTGFAPAREQAAAFLFSGQGAQYAGMGRGLYEAEPVFRAQVDLCCERLRPHLGLDLRELLFAADHDAGAAERLAETHFTQPALFVIEHSLARLWMEWGIRPKAMLGHSIGEYVAACLAGVFSLEDALALVAERGRLMAGVPAGAMLAVPLTEESLAPWLGAELSLAAVNAPDRCVVSGPHAAVEALHAELLARGVAARPLHTSHAFHSGMMEPVLASFRERLADVVLHAPRIPYLSNVTGTWITAEEATDPEYWARHLRQAVRFADGVRELCKDPGLVLLEVGPGQTLATLARQHPDCGSRTVLSSLRHPKERKADLPLLLRALGQLWLQGVEPDWEAFHARERRRRVPLPTYPFERQRHWVELNSAGARAGAAPALDPAKKQDIADWFYLPYWKPSATPSPAPAAVERAGRWLIFCDDSGVGERAAAQLAGAGRRVAAARAGEAFHKLGEGAYELEPGRREDYDTLVKDLAAGGGLPDCILHLWNVGPLAAGPEALERLPERGFWSLLYLAQALGRANVTQRIHLAAVSSSMQRVAGEERLVPERALLLGPVKTMSQEYPNVRCVSVDIALPAGEALIGRLIAEATAEPSHPVVAYRGGSRWVQSYEAVRLDPPAAGAVRLRERGVYLITGGVGGLGLTFAELLARDFRARLVLLGASEMPERGGWDEWLAAHGEEDRASSRIRRLRELEALGAEVMAVSADVADGERMRAVVAAAFSRFGELHGVIHAAGLPGGGTIQLKTAEAASRVLSPKVAGTRALMAAVAGLPLDFVAFCSSTLAVAGGLGQVDYCAANNFLDAFAHDAALAGGPPVVSINWGLWEEVGMAVATGLVPGRGTASRSPAAEAIHPLLDRCLRQIAGQALYATSLGPARHWVLNEHRIVGVPTLPGTTHLELARAAFVHHEAAFGQGAPDGGVELRDVFFLSPLQVPAGEREVRVSLERDGGAFTFQVMSRLDPPEGGEPGWQPHARGKVAALAPALRREPLDLAAIRARCEREITFAEGAADPGEKLVYWGPHWQSLQGIHLGQGEALARLELPAEFAHELGPYGLHPALLDVATAIASAGERESFLPLSYRRVRAHGPLPRRFFSYLRQQGRPAGGGETLAVDIVILSESGEPLVEIDHFTMKRVGEAAGAFRRAADAPEAAGRPLERPVEAARAEPAAGPVDAGESAGILPREGAEALRRVLARDLAAPQIAATARDLHLLIAQASSVDRSAILAAGAAVTATHARPSLPTPYVVPRNEVERRMAEVWQATLGIEQIGVLDNFFDLGGDSLLGIQLLARASEAGIQLSPDQLFEHQTIGELAKVLATDAREEPAAAPPPATSFERELLAAHPGLAERIERLRGQGLRPESAAWLLSWEGREPSPALDPAAWGGGAGPREPVSVRLDTEETRALLVEIPDLQRVRPEEAILAALAKTLARGAGGHPVLVGVEVDARGAGAAPDGFSATLPVLLDFGGSGDLVEELRLAKEQLRATVANGLDPVLLGRLTGDEDLQRRLAALPSPEVRLAYLGDGPAAGNLANGADGAALTVTGRLDGDGVLFDWRSNGFGGALVTMAAAFLAELRALIAVCRSPTVAVYTPSDFPDAQLSQEELDKLFS
jgi:acyl transferase domain-containing protein